MPASVRTAARMNDHAIAAIHGGEWKPSLRQLAERAINDAETLSALSAPDAPPVDDDAFTALEDTAWESRRALHVWFQEQGVPIAMLHKLGGVL